MRKDTLFITITTVVVILTVELRFIHTKSDEYNYKGFESHQNSLEKECLH